MFRVPLLALALAMTTATATAADSYWVFYGGYTGGKAGGEGIMVGTLDRATGSLSKPELAAKVTSPSFLAIAPNGQTLYAVGETEGKEGGGVFAYRIDPATGKLTLLNHLMSGGNAPCHVVTDAAGKFAVASNYTGGSVAVFSLADDGSLKDAPPSSNSRARASTPAIRKPHTPTALRSTRPASSSCSATSAPTSSASSNWTARPGRSRRTRRCRSSPSPPAPARGTSP